IVRLNKGRQLFISLQFSMSKYFAYIRPKQDIAISVMRREIQRYAKRNRLDIAEWFQEGYRSAAEPRPVFRRVLKHLKAGKASGVITDSLERFTRNVMEMVELRELADHGVDFHFVAHRRYERGLGRTLGSEAIRVLSFLQSFESTVT